MSERITKKHLHFYIERLNEMGVGNYTLDCAYGGYRLCRIVNAGGGQRDITLRGTARETYDCIRAFIAGVEAAREVAQ